jgi:hypothetical protein
MLGCYGCRFILAQKTTVFGTDQVLLQGSRAAAGLGCGNK